jgi:hypothetical protein
MSQTIHMVCGGESTETRQGRITDERFEWESKQVQKERFEDHIILRGTAEERVKQQAFTIGTYQADLRTANYQIKELQNEIKWLKIKLADHEGVLA